MKELEPRHSRFNSSQDIFYHMSSLHLFPVPLQCNTTNKRQISLHYMIYYYLLQVGNSLMIAHLLHTYSVFQINTYCRFFFSRNTHDMQEWWHGLWHESKTLHCLKKNTHSLLVQNHVHTEFILKVELIWHNIRAWS